MKFLFQLSAVTQIAVLVHALGITILPPGGIDIAKDTAEYKACKDANPDTVVRVGRIVDYFLLTTTHTSIQYGVIRYESGFKNFLEYNDCAPFLKDGARVTNAIFCQPVTCYPCS